MLKATETENVIKNIIRDIIRECASRGVNVTDNCAAYVVRSKKITWKLFCLAITYWYVTV
jgi:hypothetical protein